MTKIKTDSTPAAKDTPATLIPVDLKLLLRASREYTPLRVFIRKYIREHRLPGFEPFVSPEISYNHNELYDADGNLKPDESESTANKNLSSLKESKK